MYAELAVYQAGSRGTFHYAVPEQFAVSVGQLVEVSFRTGRSQGIVVGLTGESPVPHPKPILDIVTPDSVVTPTQIALARWIADQTITALGACLWLMLPPGLSKRGDTLFTLLDVPVQDSPDYHDVLALLRERGPLRAGQIERALPKSGWRTALVPLIHQGVVRREAILPAPDVKARTVRTARLSVPHEQIPDVIGGLKGQKQIEVLTLLSDQPAPVEIGWITEQTGADSTVVRRLAEKGLIELGEAEIWRDPLAGKEFATSAAPTLTPAQQSAWAIIQKHVDQLQVDLLEPPRAFLLHGVTGSGKTEVYLRAIDYMLAQRRQVIVLVPEIALIAQTVRRFAARFPGRVAVVHSSLTEGERYDTWRRARAGLIDILIGPRSALFMPLPDVGLVVIDEEHDDSYKQSPPGMPPYYHAREAAIAMMNINRGTVILGSATPDVSTAYRAHRGEIEYIHLPDRIMGISTPQPSDTIPAESDAEAADSQSAPLPPVQVIDMRQELRAGNRTMFSRTLRTALNETLALGQQAMLLLNRRGTASFVLCRDCGYVVKCPRCEMPLTYHQPDELLMCHYCGFHMRQPEHCPQCQSTRIRYFGAGTASVEEAVKQEFPQARTLRWDRDTTQERDAHDTILQQFVRGDANVLVGTQMIAKGLDIPRVTLVGVILADTALGMPDYRAGERTFQLLTQVAGRAGRGWLGGRVVFQTYQPDNYAIRAASKHDYETFYTKEIEYRRTLRYPPFKRLVRIQFHYPNSAQAQREAERAAGLLRQRIAERQLTATELIGPAPAFFGRVDNVYHWHILAKTTEPALLLDELGARPGWHIDVDPTDIL